MLVFTKNESQAIEIFKSYRNIGAYSIDPKRHGVKIGDMTIHYAQLPFLPDDDTINAIAENMNSVDRRSTKGGISLKKVVKKAIKTMHKPTPKIEDTDDMERASVGIGIGMLVNMLTSDRKNRKGPPVVVIILDEKDPVRSKIIKKFVNALLKEFGLRGHDYDDVEDLFAVTPADFKRELPKKVYKKWKKQYDEIVAGTRPQDGFEIKKMVKGKKKRRKIARLINDIQSWKYIVGKVTEFSQRKKNGCMLSRDGEALKRMLMVFYSVEIRNFILGTFATEDIDRRQIEASAEALYNVYSADNLKGQKMKLCKQLSKKDKLAVKSYKSLVKIMGMTEAGKPKKAPKVVYGYNREKISKKERKQGKQGQPTTPKTNKKKFMKFFSRKKNRDFLIMLYRHTALVAMGIVIGTDEYNKSMKEILKEMDPAYAKSFAKAATEYATSKGLIETAA